MGLGGFLHHPLRFVGGPGHHLYRVAARCPPQRVVSASGRPGGWHAPGFLGAAPSDGIGPGHPRPGERPGRTLGRPGPTAHHDRQGRLAPGHCGPALCRPRGVDIRPDDAAFRLPSTGLAGRLAANLIRRTRIGVSGRAMGLSRLAEHRPGGRGSSKTTTELAVGPSGRRGCHYHPVSKRQPGLLPRHPARRWRS